MNLTELKNTPVSELITLGENMGPVSYTHLDVYKRQRICSAAAVFAMIVP